MVIDALIANILVRRESFCGETAGRTVFQLAVGRLC